MAKLLLLASLLVTILAALPPVAFSLQQVYHNHWQRRSLSCTNRAKVQVHAGTRKDDMSATLTRRSMLDNEERSTSISRRRAFGFSFAAAVTAAATNIFSAEAVSNPLNLKGSFWETGELYKKSNYALPPDPDELVASLAEAAAALESLTDVAVEGKFGDLSRLLRGGAVSESQLRLRGYALIDMIADDSSEYLASELFRTFLADFAALDATVEAAARQAKIDGGLVETLGLAVVSPFGAANEVARISNERSLGSDARIDVLAALGEASKALQKFNKAARDATKAQ